MNLENNMLKQTVVATDATTITVNGKQKYIRNLSIKDSVVYHAMDSKSIEALKGLDFLARYTGILLHGHETALYHFGTDHAECNVHIIRYLRKNMEETGNRWPVSMISLLCEMNRKRKEFTQQKIPGSFRKESGHEMYGSIMTIIETLKKRKMGLI